MQKERAFRSFGKMQRLGVSLLASLAFLGGGSDPSFLFVALASGVGSDVPLRGLTRAVVLGVPGVLGDGARSVREGVRGREI